MKPKVFCIGFHKTGTTSLGELLNDFGYRNCHGAGPIRRQLGDQKMMELLFKKDYSIIFEIVHQFDSFNDNLWFSIYKELDAEFPGSKFICVYREEQSWIKSCVRYFSHSTSPFRMYLYGHGSPIGSEERYLSVYRKHYAGVKSYFNNRQEDILYLDLKDENYVEKIKNFLGINSTTNSLPHLNKSK